MKNFLILAITILVTVTYLSRRTIQAQQLNYPHANTAASKIFYGSFAEAPKTLDPAKAYSSNEIHIIAQIVEPLLEYSYFKRPYKLVNLTSTEMPNVKYFNAHQKQVSNTNDPSNIAYTLYTIRIKPHILYAPHPAFAKDNSGKYLYLNMSNSEVENHKSLASFAKTGTRELTANDYVYEIKRLADPRINSPIYGIMQSYILGLSKLHSALQIYEQKHKKSYLDLNKFQLQGAKALNKYTIQITIKGFYPQFTYWLAMPFFAPIPWEAAKFYSQPGMEANNLTFNWQPVGTGPFMLIQNNPNKEIILQRNPNYRTVYFPSSTDPKDIQQDYTKNSGKQLPLANKLILSLERESIPRWNKFLQGYYDRSGIGTDSFDQAIKLDAHGKPLLTPEMQQKGVRLSVTTEPSIYYMGFNMQDPIVGGLSQKNKKLRQAIAIALDYEEYIQIFLNGRGVIAHSPIPPGIFGYQDGKQGFNPYIYNWHNNKAERKSIAEAKVLLQDAGYPNGIDPKTGKALILNYDIAGNNSSDDKARFAWMRKQFAKLGIQLNIRATLYNRFQEKVRTGKAQIFSWGWNADYPDPENFLFLLYSKNSKLDNGGENAANYKNSKFDKLFNAIKNMPDSSTRQEKINQAINIVRQDSPWIFGLHPVSFTLEHKWVDPLKPNSMASNSLKYQNLNHVKRSKLQKQWNKAEYEFLISFLVLLVIIIIPLFISYRNKQQKSNIKNFSKEE